MNLGWLAVAYLIGSFPSAYLIGRWLKGIDIREHGSRSMGTMNTRLVLGTWPALLVFVLDTGKGALIAWAALKLGYSVDWALAAGVVGHMFPVWIRFRGGKGLATAFGGVIAAHLFWPVAGFAITWLIAYPLSRRASDPANIWGTAGALAACVATVGSELPGLYLMLAAVAMRHIMSLAQEKHRPHPIN